jgi:hypothetical protein
MTLKQLVKKQSDELHSFLKSQGTKCWSKKDVRELMQELADALYECKDDCSAKEANFTGEQTITVETETVWDE